MNTRQGLTLTRPELDEVVASNDKNRFAIDGTGTRIRASQGHSVPVDLGLTPSAATERPVPRHRCPVPAERERRVADKSRPVHVPARSHTVTSARRRRARTDPTGRCAVLYPVIAEAARRAGANAVGLIDIGCSAGLNLNVARVGITYSTGQKLGDPSSPVQMSCSLVGDRPVPAHAMPEVVARVGIDTDPVDVTDAEEARWLRAGLSPGQPEQAAKLDAEIALAATDPPVLLQGDPVDALPDAFARVPADALPVVTTTWALSRLPLERRLRFLHRLDDAATDRAVAWVSAEGVGVAPAVPTMGDRRASGHSIIGLAMFGHSALHAEAVGRCWSRGRLLAWLADS